MLTEAVLEFLRDLASPALFETWFAAVIAILLFLGAVALGLLVVPSSVARPAVRALAGFPLFFLFGGTLGIVVYLVGGTVWFGLVVMLVLAVGAVAAWMRRLLRPAPVYRGWARKDAILRCGKELALLAGLLLVGFLLAFFGWGETGDGTVRAMSGAWGDGPLHTLNAEAFRRRSGADLSFPAFAGESFHEPFGYDFVAAMLREAEFTVGGAFALPAAGLLACLLGWSGWLAVSFLRTQDVTPAKAGASSGADSRFRGNDKGSDRSNLMDRSETGRLLRFARNDMSVFCMTGILMLAFGGFQWAVMAFRSKAWSPMAFFGHEPVWAKVEELWLVWDNHLNTFSSQKHLLLAAAFLIVLVTILREFMREYAPREGRASPPTHPAVPSANSGEVFPYKGTLLRIGIGRGYGHLFVLSVATGVLPLFHTHGFMVAGLVWLAAFMLTRSRQAFWFGALALVLALPTILWQARLFGREGFLSFTPGWMADGVFGWIMLWAVNLGVFLPLVVIAARRAVKTANRSALIIIFPAGALFLLANLIQFQPYRWDNFKLFLLAWVLLLPFVVAEMNRWRFAGAGIARWLLILVMSLTTLADLTTHLHFRVAYPVYATADRAVARRLDAELPPDAVVLAHTSEKHNHPLTLTGRKLVAGYGGWLWTRNYAWAERAALVKELWDAEPARFCTLADRFGITHVVDAAFRVRAVATEC